MARVVFAILSFLAAGVKGGRVQTSLSTESLLIQTTEMKMRARAARAPHLQLQLVQADAQIAQCLQKRRQDPQKIATSVQKGLSAVMSAVKHFMAQPPQVEKGLEVLGRELLEAISEPIREHYDDPASYQKFEEEWQTFFRRAASTGPSVQGNITLFLEDGRPDALVAAISHVLIALADGVVRFVPHETAEEVVRYVDAVGDLLGAISMAWTGFESGSGAQAIEDLYFAMREVLDQVLPEHLRNDETYGLIVGTLDGVIRNLSETVLEFQKQIVEGAVCWKVQEARKRQRPSVCPGGFYWNGEQFCLPAPALLQGHASLEGATARKVDSAAGSKAPIPDGAMVALCEEDGEFPEKIGHWCYAACPAGMEAVSAGVQCRTRCQGEFPADDKAMMCGQNPGVLAEAVINMVFGITNGAINSGLLISAMAKDGVDTSSLVHTIEAFVSMGKPFAYGTCPLPGQ